MNSKEIYLISKNKKFIDAFKNLHQKKNNIFKYIFFVIILILLNLVTIYINIYLFKEKSHINNEKITKNYIEKKLKLIIKDQNLLFQFFKLDFLSKNINKNKNNDITNILSPKEVLGKKKIRIGRNKDGGYILLDDLKDIKVVYSI